MSDLEGHLHIEPTLPPMLQLGGDPVDLLEELVVREGLDDEAVDPPLDGTNDLEGVAMFGEQDEGRPLRARGGADCSAEPVAVQLGHPRVGNDDVGIADLDVTQALVTVLDAVDAIASALEETTKALPVGPVTGCYENILFHRTTFAEFSLIAHLTLRSSGKGSANLR